MRIVSYNILDGGEGRADPLAEVILAQRPDIVALVEADDPAVLERISARAGMDFIHATGGRSAAALLSRWPIKLSIDHALIGGGGMKSLLEAVVVAPGGFEWIVGVVHLSAHAREEDEQRRERELKFVLDAFEPHRKENRAHLLVGDFNANSPTQQINPEKCKTSTKEEYRANGGQIPRRVAQALLDAGYVDTLYALDPDQAITSGTFSTQHPGQRIDYIFSWGFGANAIQQAWIETDRLAKYASDHFPVGAELSA